MAERVTFPATMIVDRQVSVTGLPTLQATLEVSEEVKTLPLPTGKQGADGPRGIPRATWIRQDPPIANAGARPVGLTDADIGKWWQRLDDNGMDTWTDIGWVHSANCVGVQGPIAFPNQVEVTETLSVPKVRTAGMLLTGPSTEQGARVTVPSGVRGIQGDPGPSTAIRTRTDYDDTIGPVHNSMFAWRNRSNIVQLSKTGKFRAQFPVSYGPWAKYGTDFAVPPALSNVDTLELVVIDIPALPFRWRPIVHAVVSLSADGGTPTAQPHLWARLDSPEGPPVGVGLYAMGLQGMQSLNASFATVLRPWFSTTGGFDKGGIYPQVRLSPSSTACTVEPYAAARIFFRAERSYGTQTTGTSITFSQTGAYAEVRAMPVSM
ncbi:hypothetical protein ACHIPZ_13890 [Antrihabitans sp. NCIMB 15449]|uniref:Minor tail protein n=1 Tax=Antrihabitans spumae TaxID=3373370 RepID=A0ABW7JMS4_9NOCA